MTKSQKITLSASRDIPFDKLVLSQANVRHVKAGISIEELAEDIARRTLLASLTVRPVLAEDGAETGMFEIPAGGRRYRALELLVKQKRLNKTAPVPCIVRTEGLAEEDSLAENVSARPCTRSISSAPSRRCGRKTGARKRSPPPFFVSPNVVKQRLKLAAVAPSLLDAYAEEELTLDQLMAFTVNPDHERQEQVWEALKRHYSKQPYEIPPNADRGRGARLGQAARSSWGSTTTSRPARRGAAATCSRPTMAAGCRTRGLLELMVASKLAEEAEAIRDEGWKWVEARGRLSLWPHLWSAPDRRRARADER